MPSFAGAFIFGAAVRMNTTNAERATQLNQFFGLDGTESLDGGFRSRITTASGLLFGTNPADCGAAVENFRSWDDGNFYTLVDTAGFTWNDVRLVQFATQDRAFAHTQLGYVRAYSAAFMHLS